MLGNKFHREANGAMFISNRPCWYVHSPLCFVLLRFPPLSVAAAVHSVQQRSTTLHSVENFSITFFLLVFPPNTQLCAVVSYHLKLLLLFNYSHFRNFLSRTKEREKIYHPKRMTPREEKHLFSSTFSLLFSPSPLLRAHSFT